MVDKRNLWRNLSQFLTSVFLACAIEQCSFGDFHRTVLHYERTRNKNQSASLLQTTEIDHFFLAFFIILLGCAFTFSMIHSSQKFAELKEEITMLKQVIDIVKLPDLILGQY